MCVCLHKKDLTNTKMRRDFLFSFRFVSSLSLGLCSWQPPINPLSLDTLLMTKAQARGTEEAGREADGERATVPVSGYNITMAGELRYTRSGSVLACSLATLVRVVSLCSDERCYCAAADARRRQATRVRETRPPKQRQRRRLLLILNPCSSRSLPSLVPSFLPPFVRSFARLDSTPQSLLPEVMRLRLRRP